jgi:hypothetical protein
MPSSWAGDKEPEKKKFGKKVENVRKKEEQERVSKRQKLICREQTLKEGKMRLFLGGKKQLLSRNSLSPFVS